MRILFCNTSYGDGGIGQHFAHLVDESRQQGILDHYYALSPRPGDAKGIEIADPTYGLLPYTPARFYPSWKSYLHNDLFDRVVARRLSVDDDAAQRTRLMGFVGKSLHTFRRGRSRGIDRLELVAANSHVDNLHRLHERAAADSGIRDSWLNGFQRRRSKEEYRLADRIYIHSEYVRQSFLEAGVSEEKLVRTHLRPAPRFQPPVERPTDDVFRIVYVGRIEMTKGIALLLEAFSRLPVHAAELTLVGGWSTRAVRKYVETHLDADPRIRLAPGDPRPVLHHADVFVHPSYEDGFGYAPMEALACGVPVIVSEDTGMKEYIHEGINGFVIPTGSVGGILSALARIRAHPLASTTSLLDQSSPPTLNPPSLTRSSV